VGPRPLSAVVVRPLNFTVRRRWPFAQQLRLSPSCPSRSWASSRWWCTTCPPRERPERAPWRQIRSWWKVRRSPSSLPRSGSATVNTQRRVQRKDCTSVVTLRKRVWTSCGYSTAASLKGAGGLAHACRCALPTGARTVTVPRLNTPPTPKVAGGTRCRFLLGFHRMSAASNNRWRGP